MKKENKKEITGAALLDRRYGFDKADYKWIPAGAEILHYIGSSVVFVEFIKEASGAWVDNIKEADILSISDYDPMTVTYLLKYRIKGEDTESSFREMRIIPEGFSWGNPDETGVMHRFIPYSLHCKLAETEMLYARVSKLYTARPSLPIEALGTISGSAETKKTLEYSCNIVAALSIDPKQDGLGKVVFFRVHNLSLRHLHKDIYLLSITDGDGNIYTQEIQGTAEEHNFLVSGKYAGKLKLIDLQDNE